LHYEEMQHEANLTVRQEKPDEHFPDCENEPNQDVQENEHEPSYEN
jgi:hypothetical protein